jgi:hypothetical protein
VTLQDSPLSVSSPAAVYEKRLNARRAVVAAQSERLDVLSYARLAAFLVGLIVAGLSFGAELFSPWFTLVPVFVFLYFVARFEMARGQKAWAERAAAFYYGALARLDGKPSGSGDGTRYADNEHPYSADLDLFGPGSVFERLTACRTRVGEETLAAWLLAPADPDEVRARQEAVRDLTPRLDLRESVAVAGTAVPAVDYQPLAEWGLAGAAVSRPQESPLAWKRWAVEILGWANVAAWVGWLFVGTTALPVLVLGIASIALAAPLVPWSRRVLAPLERAERDLSLLESVLARLERERFTAARLCQLQADMTVEGRRASAQISELRHLLHWFNSRRNPLFLPVAILRMWDVRYAFKLEAWRACSGPAVARWLRAVGEAEALSSLASHAHDNPLDVYPAIDSGPVHFAAVGLGHPLIAREKCVVNDVNLGGESGSRVLMVSGSNMSGKSTLLRAVGVNTVLALAGGVVRAASLTLTPVSLGATMRVQDSLQAGRSRFFAEVTKVRQLLDIASSGGPPLVFLLDELFSGTNSADRVAGAEGVIRALVEAGAVGFVTTHDLSLTAVTEHLPGAVNVHFRDDFEAGELRFDYTMRPGVVEHGNGLALMRAVGLKV